MIGDCVVVFLLFLIFRWVTISKRESYLAKKNAYIAALKVEKRKYQSNSTFVAKTLIEREIAKQREIVATKKPSLKEAALETICHSLIEMLFTLVIVYLWWDTPMFVFPLQEEMISSSVFSRSSFLSVYSPTSSIQSLDLSWAQWIYFQALRSPQWPLGVVGIISWGILCRSVASLIV